MLRKILCSLAIGLFLTPIVRIQAQTIYSGNLIPNNDQPANFHSPMAVLQLYTEYNAWAEFENELEAAAVIEYDADGMPYGFDQLFDEAFSPSKEVSNDWENAEPTDISEELILTEESDVVDPELSIDISEDVPADHEQENEIVDEGDTEITELFEGIQDATAQWEAAEEIVEWRDHIVLESWVDILNLKLHADWESAGTGEAEESIDF